MWQDKVKEIIYLLENSDVNEIEVRFWGRHFRVVKSSPVIVGETKSTPASTAVPATESVQPADVVKEDDVSSQSSVEVLSPMPGTFYTSPSPDADAFIKEGDQVIKGDTLCIIEAMKIMNEIEAETNGVIKKILIKDGSPIEYNQLLFLIDPS